MKNWEGEGPDAKTNISISRERNLHNSLICYLSLDLYLNDCHDQKVGFEINVFIIVRLLNFVSRIIKDLSALSSGSFHLI